MDVLGKTETFMNSLASELKAARERRNVPLSQIAEETRIGLRHFQSLEEGRYSDLPGGIYNRAFIKAYCEALNLDAQDILQKYETEISPHPEKIAKPQQHFPRQKPFWGSTPVFAWSLMLIFSAIGLFFSRNWISSVFSPYFSNSPSSALRREAASDPATRPALVEQTSALISAPVANTVEIPVESATEPQTEGASLQASISTSDSGSSLRIEFEVTEKCWISVDSDGGRVVRRVLEPGEAQTFNAAQQFFIVIGNAGGVHLRINGRPAKPLGKPGEVVKMLINSKNLPDLINQTTG